MKPICIIILLTLFSTNIIFAQKTNNHKEAERLFDLWIVEKDDSKTDEYRAIILKLAPKSEFELYFKANDLYREKKYDEALVKFEDIIQKYPSYSRAFYKIGTIITFIKKDFENSIQYLDKAIITSNAPYAELYYVRGYSYQMIGNHQKAIDDLSKAIRLDDQLFDAYNLRGYSLASLEKYENAIEDFSKAISMNQKHADYYYNRALSLTCLNKHKEAIPDYDKAIELNPKHINAYYNRGASKSAIGDTAGSKKDIDYSEELKLQGR